MAVGDGKDQGQHRIPFGLAFAGFGVRRYIAALPVPHRGG